MPRSGLTLRLLCLPLAAAVFSGVSGVSGVSAVSAASAASAVANVAAVAGAAPAAAPFSQVPVQAALTQEVGRTFRHAGAIGIHVVEVGSGQTVFTYHGDEPRATASNTKLFTTAAALDALGPDYFFETRLLLRGRLAGGVLAGDLGVVGAGDPNISGRASGGDPYAVFRGWARELQARGVRRVEGDVYLDGSLFEAQQIHPDWPREQLATWYEAPVAALSFNDNCILVRVLPGRHGGPARVETVPPLPLLQITNTARTTKSRRHNHLVVTRQGERLIVAGQVWERAGPFDVWISVPDAVRYFGAALVAALAEEGIEVRGRPRPVTHLPGPPWERVAVYRSSLLDTIRIANKRSQNFYAESLIKLLGARRCGEGSWHQGVRAVSEFLAGLGVTAGTFTMVDGSGLSRADRFTPHQMTQLLQHMYHHRWASEFVQSLPYSGESEASLHARMQQPPYRGNVYAKTGTIEGVSALSGYARAVSGRIYAFSILLNRTRGAWLARQDQDRMVMALIDHG
jgi:D-alanyl-D-alanine carboxypeptidase/D-alanyl-D-alanine-endopeptidase (penicillin-binding protein 4)